MQYIFTSEHKKNLDFFLGKTKYEMLVTSNPRQVVLWGSYADQVTRAGDFNAAHQLYTRISALGLQVNLDPIIFECAFYAQGNRHLVFALRFLPMTSTGIFMPKNFTKSVSKDVKIDLPKVVYLYVCLFQVKIFVNLDQHTPIKV